MATINAHTGILTSPKFVPLTDGAFRLWCHGLMWSKEHLTDGFIPVGMLPSLHRNAAKLVPELLKVNVPGKGPLWHAAADGYRIHDYADWQDSATDVQTRRRKWREQKQGVRKDSAPDSKVESTPESSAESQAGVGGGCGSGVGGGCGTDTQTPPARPIRAVPAFDPNGGGAWPAQRHSPAYGWRSTIGKHIPQFLYDEFRDSLANAGEGEGALIEWLASTEDAWRGKKNGDDAIDFWRARFKEWQGTSKPRVSELQPLEDFIPARFKTGGAA